MTSVGAQSDLSRLVLDGDGWERGKRRVAEEGVGGLSCAKEGTVSRAKVKKGLFWDSNTSSGFCGQEGDG